MSTLAPEVPIQEVQTAVDVPQIEDEEPVMEMPQACEDQAGDFGGSWGAPAEGATPASDLDKAWPLELFLAMIVAIQVSNDQPATADIAAVSSDANHANDDDDDDDSMIMSTLAPEVPIQEVQTAVDVPQIEDEEPVMEVSNWFDEEMAPFHREDYW
eukprot:s281_g15.t1